MPGRNEIPGAPPAFNASLSFYGLFVLFVGVLTSALAVLGLVFVLGLAVASGGINLFIAFMLRDAVCFLLLGIFAFRTGGGIRRFSAAALRLWEWCTWLVATTVVVVTCAAILFIRVGVEFLVMALPYMLLAGSATTVRRNNREFFHRLQHLQNPSIGSLIL